MDVEVFISHLSRHFDFDVFIWQLFSQFFTLTLRVNIYVSREGRGINRTNERSKTQYNCSDVNNHEVYDTDYFTPMLIIQMKS